MSYDCIGRVYLVIDIFINGVKWPNLAIRVAELIRVDLPVHGVLTGLLNRNKRVYYGLSEDGFQKPITSRKETFSAKNIIVF